MRKSLKENDAFDRLFMAHLGSRLRAEYDRRFRDPMPSRFWDLLLKLALLEALSQRQERHGAGPRKAGNGAARQN